MEKSFKVYTTKEHDERIKDINLKLDLISYSIEALSNEIDKLKKENSNCSTPNSYCSTPNSYCSECQHKDELLAIYKEIIDKIKSFNF